MSDHKGISTCLNQSDRIKVYSSDYSYRVRYADTDKMGYMYYGNYAVLYEIGRIELLRGLGLTYREMEDDYRIMLPVASVEARYILPAKYDEELIIRTKIEVKPTRVIAFGCEILNERAELIHKATVKLVFVSMDDQKSIPCPDFLMDKLSGYFESREQ
ncbi:MAG TPA: thioesterase family protein [Saprospiraceae bacterium]|nr:thioesterase family protein [Saprospiraceae bacterium]HRP42198.1 thioesterase family protein [Saprospiraceae bacterium]